MSSSSQITAQDPASQGTPLSSSLPHADPAAWHNTLSRSLPFAQMARPDLATLVAAATPVRYAAGDTVLDPRSGPVMALLCVLQGSVTGRHGMADVSGGFEYTPGDVFPVGAAMGGRAVTASYVANEDTLCLRLPLDRAQALAEVSPPFGEFLNRRVLQYLDQARRLAQSGATSQALAEQSLEARLDSLPPRDPLGCSPDTPLAVALARMHERRVGSMLVLDDRGMPQGILTRHDILGRVTLPQQPLQTPIAQVMSAPVHCLDSACTLQDAALLMSRHGIRHVPVLAQGRVVNVVSERDLFALQRLSLRELSAQIGGAADVGALRHLAQQTRQFAANLLGQGVQARQITELVSHLNDCITGRLLDLVAQSRAMDLARACWVAFGSEGRGEQTVATDQDNGLIFVSDRPDRDRPAWLALAREVNEALDVCGYPLCAGQVMASNPACCLTSSEWLARFGDWVERGAPDDLLRCSIYFDLRPLSGQVALADPLRAWLARAPGQVPRFLKQLAGNALRLRPALNWRGALDTQEVDGRPLLDLKLHGTAVFVDAARLYALAHGLPALGTRARLEAAAPLMHVTPQEGQAWITAFEFLQQLRLQVQIGPARSQSQANLLDVRTLNDIDRRMLKEALRIARRLQQRLALDYQR